MDGKANVYSITLECSETNEVEQGKVFLFVSEYKRMLKQINEIVYIDDNKKQWALKKIEKI